MDRGAWKAAVHGVAEGRTQLSDFTFTFHFHALEKKMATHSSVLAWRIPGTGKPVGLPSMGLYWVGHDWSDLAIAIVVSLFRFLSLHDSVLVGYLFLGIYSFLLGCPKCWHIIIHVVQSLSSVWLFASPWTAAHQASLSFTIYWSLLKLMSIE